MHNFKLVLTTSGTGSRLGELTKFTNKGLMRVGKKPVISHIIDSYPKNVEIIITLGYFGDHIKDFVLMAYPDRKIQFIEVDDFKSSKSSLLYSLSKVEKYIDSPFYYHASDTICPEFKPVAIDSNFVVGKPGNGSSEYASFQVKGDIITHFEGKGALTADYIHVGLVGILDYKLFFDEVKNLFNASDYNSSFGDVNVIQELIKKKQKFEYQEINQWFDTGSVRGLKKAKEFYYSDDFNVLDKQKESVFIINKEVYKFFAESSLTQQRIERAKKLSEFGPKLTGQGRFFFKYQYIEGDLLSTKHDTTLISALLDRCNKHLWPPNLNSKIDDFKKIARTFYERKTFQRIDQFFEQENLEVEPIIINNMKVGYIKDLLQEIEWDKLCDSIEPSNFHGDFILDNILVDQNLDFKLIDWRQDFGGSINDGDVYYDLGKFAHNLVVNHHIIDSNQFRIEYITPEQVNINILRPFSLVEFEKEFFKWIRKNNYDEIKVKLMRSIIWLNMSPLHHHPFNNFLFLLGKYSLNEVLNEIRKSNI